jgi:hypothetical protein
VIVGVKFLLEQFKIRQKCNTLDSSFLQQCKKKYTAQFNWTSCSSLSLVGLGVTTDQIHTCVVTLWCYSQARQGRERRDCPVELCSVLPFALMEEGGSNGFLKELHTN